MGDVPMLATDMADTTTGARGPLRLPKNLARYPRALTPTLTSMEPTLMQDTATTQLTLPTLMVLTELTHLLMVPTITARGLLMPRPGMDTDTDIPMLATDTVADTMARGPLRLPKSLLKLLRALTPTLTSTVPTLMQDMATATFMLPTLMLLTQRTHMLMVVTTMARGLLMPTPGATTDADIAVTAMAASDTTVNPPSVLLALLSVLKMSSNHPQHIKYYSHSC